MVPKKRTFSTAKQGRANKSKKQQAKDASNGKKIANINKKIAGPAAKAITPTASSTSNGKKLKTTLTSTSAAPLKTASRAVSSAPSALGGAEAEDEAHEEEEEEEGAEQAVEAGEPKRKRHRRKKNEPEPDYTKIMKARVEESTQKRTGHSCDRCKIKKLTCKPGPTGACQVCEEKNLLCRATDRASGNVVIRGAPSQEALLVETERLEKEIVDLKKKLEQCESRTCNCSNLQAQIDTLLNQNLQLNQRLLTYQSLHGPLPEDSQVSNPIASNNLSQNWPPPPSQAQQPMLLPQQPLNAFDHYLNHDRGIGMDLSNQYSMDTGMGVIEDIGTGINMNPISPDLMSLSMGMGETLQPNTTIASPNNNNLNIQVGTEPDTTGFWPGLTNMLWGEEPTRSNTTLALPRPTDIGYNGPNLTPVFKAPASVFPVEPTQRAKGLWARYQGWQPSYNSPDENEMEIAGLFNEHNQAMDNEFAQQENEIYQQQSLESSIDPTLIGPAEEEYDYEYGDDFTHSYDNDSNVNPSEGF